MSAPPEPTRAAEHATAAVGAAALARQDGTVRAAARASWRVALVYLRAQAGGDFFADTPFCLAAAELRDAGFGAEVFEVFLDRDDDATSNGRLDALVERLREGRFDVVAFEHVWQPALIARVSALGALCLLTEADAAIAHAPLLRLRHLTNHRQPLLDLVAALASGGDLLEVPNLHLTLSDGTTCPSRREQAHPEVADALRPFHPVVDVHIIGEARARDGSRPPRRKTLDTNKGCPFSADVRSNPRFADLDLPEQGVTLAGCAFCFMGGDYRALSWRETVAIHCDQIAYYQRELPAATGAGLDEVVLRDQHAIRYLPHLLREAIARGLAPVGVLVPGRGDAIIRYGEALAEAAALAEGSGFWFTIYLIGFESFSDSQLELYNKGVRAADYARALAALRDLHRAHPDTFRLYAYGSSSFILWNPWTTLDELEETTRFAREHAAVALAHGIGDTRLRLYPHLPLWHRARADGLLVDEGGEERAGGATADAGSTHTGYAAASPWRYRDGRLAYAEALAYRLLRHAVVSAAIGVLESAIDWAARRFAAPLPPLGREALEASAAIAEIDALSQAWVALRARWRRPPEARTSAPVAAAARAASAPMAAARTLLLGRACNNACLRCVGGHAEYDDDPARLLRAAQSAGAAAAAGGSDAVFAGREPTLLPALPRLAHAARDGGAEGVELLSNGRALALPGIVARLRSAGVRRLLVKRHRLDDEAEDAYARAPGAGAQMWAGVAAWTAVGGRWRLLAVVVGGAEAELGGIVDRAAAAGAEGVTVHVQAGEVVLERVDALERALDDAAARAGAAGLAIEVEGF